MRDNGVENFVAGFLLGGIIGAGVALLFAPASGKETREQIAVRANKAYEDGKEGAEYVRKLVQEEVAAVRDGAEKVKEAVHKGVEQIKPKKA
ncbi:MAG TPA: YtxH domain-containing protein [candidate division Zixibacteria bacterium]|nr:YtxH domain-containing protein [candidate division Zixibacteria bacterium]